MKRTQPLLAVAALLGIMGASPGDDPAEARRLRLVASGRCTSCRKKEWDCRCRPAREVKS